MRMNHLKSHYKLNTVHSTHLSFFPTEIYLAQYVYKPHVYVYNHTTYGTGIYQMRCTAYKVAPEDGVIQSETCRAYIKK